MDRDEAYRIWQHHERELSQASQNFRDLDELWQAAADRFNSARQACDAAEAQYRRLETEDAPRA